MAKPKRRLEFVRPGNHPLSVVEVAAINATLAEKQRAAQAFAEVFKVILEARGLDPTGQYRIEGNVIIPVGKGEEIDASSEAP